MKHENTNNHPRLRANFLSVIFYIFTYDTFRRGFKRKWKTDNLYDTIDSLKSEALGNDIERRWKEETKLSKLKNRPGSLLKVMLTMFSTELLCGATLLAISQIVLKLAEPILLGKLLKYFKEEDSIAENDAIRYGLYIAGVIGGRIVLYNQYKVLTYKTVLKARIACCALIYRKVMKLSMTSLQQTTGGQIMNFISYDLSRFDFGTDLIHFVWVAPIFVISIIYILYSETGIAGLTGVLWFSLLAILQSYSGNLTATIYGRMNRKSGNRLRIMNEIIHGIQVIKMYAWEKSFVKLIRVARNEELNAVTKLNYVRNIYLSFSSISNHLALFFTLMVVISMKQAISSALVYGLVVYYGVLNFIVSIMFILAISKMVETWKIIQRINDFLLKEEFLVLPAIEGSSNTIVQMDGVEARWNSSTSLYNMNKLQKPKMMAGSGANNQENQMLMSGYQSKIVLQNITLALKHGKLVGIVGPVGSGKSSLLQTILGELELTSGTVRVHQSVSYASQDAWTFAGTVRENIIFGEVFNDLRYKEVVRVCCLERDFELFPNGDLTVVGDRGASLSGGQKSRINLARAVYRKRNIYLLDDPLSAVDVQVAKHIYQECIEGYLKNKCRILVTHHVHHLKTSDYIIVLNQGLIQDSGKYDELLRKNGIFADTNSIIKNQTISSEIQDGPTKLNEVPFDDDDDDDDSIEEEPFDKLNTADTLECDSGMKKSRSVMTHFLKGINWPFLLLILFLFTFIQIIQTCTDFFLSGWVNLEEHGDQPSKLRILETLNIEFPTLETETCLYTYGVLICGIALFSVIKSVLYVNFFRGNSKKLHDNMFKKVIHASMEFFDNTSSGQILNRFSREMQVTDEFIPRTILEALMFVNSLLAAIGIVLLLNPYIVIMAAFMGVNFIVFSIIYMRTSRNIKEVESGLMSPILSHLNESISGLITIRGLNAQNIVGKRFGQLLDIYTSSWYMLATVFAAFGFYIEFVSFLFISIVTLSLIMIGRNVGLTASEAGLAITQSMTLSAIVQYGVLNCAQLSYLLVSVRRILEYNTIPQEIEPINPVQPAPNWPERGSIVFRNVNLRYSESRPAVLKNLNFTIDPCEKVGIVGRTGAGKSSLLSALFRLSKIDGQIEIDGLDTNTLSLQALRSKLSIIPQDPVLFNGTLRFNLDPFEEYDDSVLYDAIRAVELNSFGQLQKLTARVRDKGSNFSVGQRQLICLARAIIRRNKIVILDEATANVDSQTDITIQKTMSKQFSNCTVLTVAHRLSTVMNCDRILVIDSGELIEMGHPHVLLNNTKGKFHCMVDQTGLAMSQHLRDIAFQQYKEKNKLVNTEVITDVS